MDGYKEENWLAIYQAALVELDHAKMSGRIGAARGAIVDRLAKLLNILGLHTEERNAIEDATTMLRILEEDEQRFNAQERERKLREAEEKLRSLAPVIERIQKQSGRQDE